MVAVLVVNVREVRMAVAQGRVVMLVRVGFSSRILVGVLMLVVRIVQVRVRVRQRLVQVFVLVMLRDVQPDAERHQHSGEIERQRDGLSVEDYREQGANKR